MKKNGKSLVEGVSESTAACLLVMGQGSILLTITGAHLLIAAQTGVIAGGIAFLVAWFAQFKRFWAMPLLLGICTAVADFYVHPGSFGSFATEAIVTGCVAGVISLCVALFIRFMKRRPREG
ncbi:hypothetical protein, partial [Marinobacter alexandrii]|uniref:hypothetical protein n=1 Tax=Marinobacter alexandrii TaxID=2570351 RepID=UPI003298A0B7